MNKWVSGLLGGAAGAVCTTLLHELIRHRVDDAPRLDLLGEEALNKTSEAITGESIDPENRYAASMAGDIFGNAWYYSAAATCPWPITAGTTLGVLAGLGAIGLPGPLGLDADTTNASSQRRWITLGLYTIGGLVSGTVIRCLRRKAK